MRIAEIYESKQGEGLLTGTPSVFVRLSGCNLRCSFCDTPFASWHPEGESQSVDQVMDSISRWGSTHVVITGGEPMIFKQLPDLCGRLADQRFHITIETAGTCWMDLECDLMSISPKLSNSTPPVDRAGDWTARHESTRQRPEIVQQLMGRYGYQLKFVVDCPEDTGEIDDYLGQLSGIDHDRILMMPQGISVSQLEARESWLRPWCESRGYLYCDRMHIHWYGNKRGT